MEEFAFQPVTPGPVSKARKIDMYRDKVVTTSFHDQGGGGGDLPWTAIPESDGFTDGEGELLHIDCFLVGTVSHLTECGR